MPVRPSAAVLRVTQDRLAEKDFVAALGHPGHRLRPGRGCGRPGRAARERLGPGVLKTVRLGYDGKGQIRVDRGADAGGGVARLGGSRC